MNMPSLNGKTALVTGASRGMGRASALALAAAGAQVLVHYGRGAKEADGVVAAIRKGGGRADAIIAPNVPSSNNDVPHIDADSEFNPSLRRQINSPLCHTPLNL